MFLYFSIIFCSFFNTNPNKYNLNSRDLLSEHSTAINDLFDNNNEIKKIIRDCTENIAKLIEDINMSNCNNTIFECEKKDSENNNLYRVYNKKSKCGNCCTCKKNKICMFKTYEILIKILESNLESNIFEKQNLNNEMLIKILNEINEYKELNCYVTRFWSMNPKLKHLICPGFLQTVNDKNKSEEIKRLNEKMNFLMAIMLAKNGFDINSLLLLNEEIDTKLLLLLNDKLDKETLTLYLLLNKR